MKHVIEPIVLLLCAAVLLAICVVWIKTGWPLLTMLGVLLIGWFHVTVRIGPQIEWNLIGIATGVLCASLTILVLHWCGCWFYAEIRARNERNAWPSTWRWRWTLCLVAGVMMMFSAGLVGVGLVRTTRWFVETPQIVRARSIG